MGKSSAYLLAWCYTNSRQFVRGAELFLKFADLETNWEKPEQRNMGQVADAKLRTAENYVQKAVRLEKALEQQGTVLVRAESIRRALSTSIGQVAGAGEVHAELRKSIYKTRRR